MSSDAATYVAATSRPLAVRRRQDLGVQRLDGEDGSLWAIKDPLTLRYWHLGEEEFFIFNRLDGRTSSNTLGAECARRFGTGRWDPQQIQNFLTHLHQEGLILADRPGQGGELVFRAQRRRRRAWMETLSNPLAWRFPPVDAGRFLSWLTPRASWLFSAGFAPVYLTLLLAAALVAAVAVPRRFDPAAASEWLRGGNALWLFVAIGSAKVLHELGHAVACRRYGAECRQIGLMVLVGAPCLYCNVSDAWMLPSLHARLMITAAGILAELGLAAVCTLLWWASEPGPLNALCLSIMVVCSVNTVLLNGNPLLRYDGYYLLSDWTHTPNLAQQGTQIVRRWFARAILGLKLPAERPVSRRRQAWMAVYAVASACYRWVLTLVILWFLNRWLRPYGLEAVSYLLGVMFLLTLIGLPALRGIQFLRHPVRSYQVRWNRVLGRGLLPALAIGGLCLIPLPRHVSAPVVIEARDAATVYVVFPGRVVWQARPGQRVERGDPIARLESPEMARELLRLRGQRDARRLHLQHLNSLLANAQAAAEVPTAEKALADAQAQLDQREGDFARLTLRAERAGYLLPVRASAAAPTEGLLPTWTGSPLDPHNLGSYLESRTPVCEIGDPELVDAVLQVDQSAAALLGLGQEVSLRLDQLPALRLRGQISRLAERTESEAPAELLERGAIPAKTDAQGTLRPQERLQQARARLDPAGEPLQVGATGRASVRVANASLAERLLRFMNGAFHFRL